MFIQTEATESPDRMKFLPGLAVLPSGTLAFDDEAAAGESPLASRLFAVDEVEGVELGADYITVTKAADADWRILKPAVLGAVMEHFVAGDAVLAVGSAAAPDDIVPDDIVEDESADAAILAEIRELIETRIRPTAAQGGGDVAYRGYKEGVVLLEFKGPAFSLMAGIENMLKHYVPEVKGVANFRDAQAKPGLETPEGIAVKEVLDTAINPSVATHGGHIALVDVKDDTVYIRLEGGCQGCGMADVTLKQGVEVQIMQAVPSIRQVLDVTDHNSGDNPYYQPSK
jgi:Fe-S cluster biogenesis protein NfuA